MRKKIGRPSILENEELQEEYIKIYISKFFHKVPDWELAQKYNCSKVRISNALKWVNESFIKIPNKTLLSGSIYSIQERIKILTKELRRELKKRNPATRSLVEINRELRSDEIELLKLQSLYQERYSIEIENKGSVREILDIISKKNK